MAERPDWTRATPAPPARPEAEDLDLLLQELRAALGSRVVFRDHQAVAVALFVANTYCWEAWSTVPYLDVSSAAMRAGKTRLLEMIELLANRTLATANISEAAMFRVIEMDSPTLLIDEMDQLLAGGGERARALQGLVNAGHRRGGQVVRMVNFTEPTPFSVFCPKVLAGIGQLPATMADRSIPIRLQRKLTSEKVRPLRLTDRTVGQAEAFRNRLRAAIAPLQAEIEAVEEESVGVPEGLSDRAADCWLPLLWLADRAGGGWPAEAREAAVALSADQAWKEQAEVDQLLLDARDAFGDEGALHTAELIRRLHQPEDSYWRDWGKRGDGLTAAGLGRLLRPLEIGPAKPIRIGESNARGYLREWFEPVWARWS